MKEMEHTLLDRPYSDEVSEKSSNSSLFSLRREIEKMQVCLHLNSRIPENL